MPREANRETELYAPVKRYLEEQGYTVKGEVDDCDVVAVILQAVARLRLSSTVYVGVPRGCPILRSQRRHVIRLFRMLGLGTELCSVVELMYSLEVPRLKT